MKFPKLQRNHWIMLALVLALTAEVGHYIWAHWGLITVHSKGQPLSQVIRSIEKQGHVTIKTNMDLTKPVVMRVDEVSLAEALETLSVVTEGRWRLAYFVGPDKSTVNVALANFTADQKNEGWRTVYVPLVAPVGEELAVLPDPRKDSWVVKTVQDATLQAYLTEAAKNVSASFLVPEGFNPAVKSPPASGAISSALPKLVSAAKGKYEEVFILQGSNRQAEGGDRERRDRGDGETRFAGNFGGGFDRDAFEERIQNEINKLPPEERPAAQKEHEDQKQFFTALRDMSPEDRAKMMQQMMSDPNMQEKMDNASAARDSRRSPQQKAARANSYLQRLSAVHGGK
jgi:hypothetical protein